MAVIIGTEFDEELLGTAGVDTIDALEGDDVVFGEGGADTINGGDGNDTLDGGDGDDIVNGGDGDDFITGNLDGFDPETTLIQTLSGDNGNDTIIGSEGRDDIYGGAGNDILVGNRGRDRLYGGDGDDVLDGGFPGSAGSSILRNYFEGGTGNDTYIVDATDFFYDPTSSLLQIVELAGEGDDTIILTGVSSGLSLGGYPWTANLTNIENLTVTGFSSAYLEGNALTNRLTGNDGANTLDGKAGADILEGKGGNDVYFVDQTGDAVIEAANGGTDTVRSSVKYTLSADLENLILTGALAINGAGNAANNALTGNAAANILYGYAGKDILKGGGGDDRFYGGEGNDTYYVDSAGDLALEALNQGTDMVVASIDYTLGNYLENLRLAQGVLPLAGNGNALSNVIIGNDGANDLDGKAGADDMRGGAGDDSYTVDNIGDTIQERAGAGDDTVRSTVTHTLSANVEKLVLLGTAAINGTGNALANALTGNAGANILDGQGGADTMTGGLEMTSMFSIQVSTKRSKAQMAASIGSSLRKPA